MKSESHSTRRPTSSRGRIRPAACIGNTQASTICRSLQVNFAKLSNASIWQLKTANPAGTIEIHLQSENHAIHPSPGMRIRCSIGYEKTKCAVEGFLGVDGTDGSRQGGISDLMGAAVAQAEVAATKAVTKGLVPLRVFSASGRINRVASRVLPESGKFKARHAAVGSENSVGLGFIRIIADVVTDVGRAVGAKGFGRYADFIAGTGNDFRTDQFV